MTIEFKTFGQGDTGLLWQQIDTLPHDGSHRTTNLMRFEGHSLHSFPETSTVYGFVVAAHTVFSVARVNERMLNHGDWFRVSGADLLVADSDAVVIVAEVEDHTAPAVFGGPVEPKGRLRYIDGCSDTVLASPPRLGDPLSLIHI